MPDFIDSSSDAQTRPPVLRSRSRWRAAVRLVVWCLICLVAPLVVFHGQPFTGPDAQQEKGEGRRRGLADTIDVPKVIEELRAAQPDYIGIGNSMMFTRLGMKPGPISTLSSKKFFFIYKAGSDAPVWYLLLKNVVAASGVHPKAVFLFVRDNELTAPYTGKTGDLAYLKSIGAEHDPVLDKFMHKEPAGAAAAGRVDQWLADAYAFPEWREAMSRRFTDLAMDLGGGKVAKKAQRFALSARFSLDHLRGDLRSDLPQADESDLMPSGYAEGTEVSLLPEMINTVKAAGTRLLVFRVKRRPDAVTNLPEEPAAMQAYAGFLDGWLKQRGGLFFDETYDLSIHLTDYLDGDHIRPERLAWYQGYFWQRMQGVLP